MDERPVVGGFTDQREHWASYIRSRAFSWHHLYARGNVSYQPLTSDDSRSLSRVLERIEDDSAVQYLTLLRFISDPRVTEFFAKDLDILLRSASRATSPIREISRAGVRGRILWGPTLANRQTGRVDIASFITTRRTASWNTPENQLLIHFLRGLQEQLDRIEKKADVRGIWEKLDELRDSVDQALSHFWVRDIAVPRRATSMMRARARRAKEPRYAVMADLQTDFQEAVVASRWESIFALVARGWLAPITSDDLFELHTLVRVLETLRQEIGSPISVGLIKPGRQEIAVYASRDTIIRVFFDQSPTTVFGAESQYTSILESYAGMRATPRRPDIMISSKSSTRPDRFLLIECKKSEDDGYTRDSIYKALGYLRDFSKLWIETERFPKAVVVFPAFVQPRIGSARGVSDIWLVGAEEDGVTDALRALLSD